MYRVTQNFVEHPVPSAFVVDDYSADDVAAAIIERGNQTEPFYIFDMDNTYRNIQRFRQKMPRVQMFYAMKSNDSDMIIKLAIAMGLGFDCASPGEIHKIISFNVNPRSIIYADPSKAPEQMVYARLAGVKHTTFNSSCELQKLKKYWPDAKLLIRIKVESNSVYKLGEKFGCDAKTEGVELLDEAASLGLTVIGVAFHVGSGCSSLDSYVEGIRQARALFDHEANAGRHMKILDIGGGFFAEKYEEFDQVSQLINTSLAQLFPDPEVQVTAEPGRFVSESAFKLYCNINNVKTVLQNNKRINAINISDGINGTLRSFELWHKVYKFNRLAQEKDNLVETILLGPTTDPKDYMGPFQLPQCAPRDWLVFTLQGAYSFVYSGRFSGFQVALVRPVVSTRVWTQIRDSPVFREDDFIVQPDIGAPLPTTLPPLLPSTLSLRKNAVTGS